ncbi:MFS transporter [Pseudarthrobacter phenanthrenivorans]|uniref:MFS transporter n=1 Tax=Pseudarthrobacter phenanthrenivorans TaxID=361575 RepID=UPI002F35DA19
MSNNAVVIICMLVTVMEGYNLIVFGAVVPLLLQDKGMGIDEQTTGIVGGIVYIGALTGILLGNSLADRIGRHKVMTASAAIFAIGAVAAALAPNPGLVGVARFVTGIGVGGAITTAMTLARNHAPQGRASLVMNVWLAKAMKGLGFDLTTALLFVFALTGAAVLGSFVAGAAPDDPVDPAKYKVLETRLREPERENDFLKESFGFLRQRTTVEDLYRPVQEQNADFPVAWMCRQLQLPRAT